RDRTVTGVQTCALPISLAKLVNPARELSQSRLALRRCAGSGRGASRRSNGFTRRKSRRGRAQQREPAPQRRRHVRVGRERVQVRSEERRGGKAGKCGWG